MSARLEAGKRADVIVIDTRRLPLAPVQSVISNLVYSNDSWAVRDEYVATRGQWRWE